jgi:NAD(P)-dependent dehydrogenase (short-subunit alcohol dehydrogenase family)
MPRATAQDPRGAVSGTDGFAKCGVRASVGVVSHAASDGTSQWKTFGERVIYDNPWVWPGHNGRSRYESTIRIASVTCGSGGGRPTHPGQRWPTFLALVASVMMYSSLSRAAKAAEWSLTNGIRLELASQGTTVTGLHLASTDTDMMAGFDGKKNDPADVVRTALDGLEAGAIEILADEDTVQVKAALSADPSVLYPQAASAA